MSNISELKEIIRQSLENKGVLQQIKAQIRAEVFLSLEGNDSTISSLEKPLEIYLACELIKELLISLDYRNTLTVFCQESNPTTSSSSTTSPSEMLVNKHFLASELGLQLNDDENNPHRAGGQDGTKSVPLLLLIIRMLQDMKAQRIDEEILR